ncbi:helix-turn-helix transcriptional regulator [Streptomyces sp. CBMA152]|uniref:helix-turn-helix transcriptional regulator n=1 Tax=Streptomyces sp. CBMA152 TaxID=1896312 RepID=UPI0016610968|nr:helix-turn-helix transcriptional regulator [Streptomyces sp. CBMA152]
MRNSNSLCDEVLSQMRPLIESVVNDVQIRALEDSTLAVIDDRSVAANTLESLVERAEHSVTMLVPNSEDALPVVGAALRGLAARRPRDIRVRILAAPDLAGDDRLARLGAIVEGVEIRLAAADVRQAALVVDRQVALVRSPGVVTPGAEASIIRAPGVVRALHDLMMTAWHRAAPLAKYQQLQEYLSSDCGTRILQMLGDGCTDEAAARELDMSVRTYRRRVADIMRLLGARSRFQAGLHAARMGLLQA